MHSAHHGADKPFDMTAEVRFAHRAVIESNAILGVPSENGPYRTLVLSGGWNPSIERRHGAYGPKLCQITRWRNNH